MLVATGQNISAPLPCETCFHAMTLEPNASESQVFSSTCALLEGTYEKETGAYGRIRPSSFGTPRLFCRRNWWSSPVGLGFSIRLAQAADSHHCLVSVFTHFPSACFTPRRAASLWLHRSTMHLRRFWVHTAPTQRCANTHMVAER